MPNKSPKKWFPGCIAKISLRKVDRIAESMKKHFPYFDTWEEAHKYMIDRANMDLAKYKKLLASTERHLSKVKAMQRPAETNDSTDSEGAKG